MRKTILYSLLFTLLSLSATLKAQTVSITSNLTNSVNIVTGSSGTYHAGEHLYLESEVGAGNFTTAATAINQVAFSLYAVGTNTTISNFKIYMKEVPGATTTLATGTFSTAGYTEVFNGSFTVTATGWVIFNLSTPFVRTAGMNLQVMTTREDVLVHTGFSWESSAGNTVAGNAAFTSRRYNGSTALSGSTSLTASNFRASIRLSHAAANDATLNFFNSVGKLPIGYGSTQPVVASVTNTGTSALTNVPVTLNVTGANTYTGIKTIASLAPGATTTVAFDGYVPSAAGSSTLSVSLGADGDNTNNTAASQTQITTTNIFALSNNDAFTPNGSIGFNTGSGNLLIKMPVYKNASLTSIRVSISSDAAVAGNTVYGVLLSSTGALIAQTPNYIVQNADLGQYVTFTFAAPQAVTAGTTYYIGLAQTANTTTGYYPVNTQSTKPNLAHSTVLAGGTVSDYTTFGSLMIEGQFATAFPVDITLFTGSRQGTINLLRWTTATENNNKGFEIERSADGTRFSSIGFIATKAEGGFSASSLNYSFADEKALTGTNYYRLKQVDRDGKTTYSSIVIIKGEKVEFEISALYPNPVRNGMNIDVVSAKNRNITISVTDLTGKEIKRITSAIVAGDNNIDLNVSSLAAGTYYLRITSGMETRTTRFIKN
jgi:hypothetical protein